MALNFNVSPYYDDFDPNKNFHRILFKPGFAVQARELTQSQTILQDQVSKFASHIFAKNTPISGGKVTLNNNCYFLKLNNTTPAGDALDVSKFTGILIQNQSGDVLAQVLAVRAATGSTASAGDPPTLIVSYISGVHFGSQDVVFSVYDPTVQATVITETNNNPATGLSSIASISDGVFYVINGFNISNTDSSQYSIGNFVNVLSQTVILDAYDNTPSLRVGLNITESVYDYIDDVTLLDQASGAPNFQGPGADRYVINLTLESRPLSLGDDDGFIELVRIQEGEIIKQNDSTVYSTIDDYFAKRTFDTNGDYIVNDFKLSTSANTYNSDTYDLKIGKGIAYVRGYRIENQSDITVIGDRARDTASVNNAGIVTEYGNYLYVNSANGFFDSSTMPSVDLHLVSVPNINSTNVVTYNSTVVATAHLRNFVYNSGTGFDINTYTYKSYIADISNKTLSSAVVTAPTPTSITLSDTTGKFSNIDNAYVGVVLSIDFGASAGDFRKIVSYTASTKTFVVDTPFTITPDTGSRVSLRFGIKDIESIVKANSTYSLLASSNVSSLSKDTGVITGNTIMSSVGSPEVIYKIGNPYVKTISDASFSTSMTFRNQSFNSGGQAQITLSGTGLSFSSASNSNFIIINNSTGLLVPQSSITSFVLSGPSDNPKGTVTINTTVGAFNGTVIAGVHVNNASDSRVLKTKTLITANTQKINTIGTSGTVNGTAFVSTADGQVYIQKAGIVAAGQSQSLYVSDVKQIVQIIDTGLSTTAPDLNMLDGSSYDVTSNFLFDNGQRDNYYGHASIRLKPGRPAVKGNLLVFFNHYAHGGGDGYFNISSYSTENYASIPKYTSTGGVTYNLRDCLDFRPKVRNAQANFVLDYTYGSMIPTDIGVFTTDYTYYLSRIDKLELLKDGTFEIVKGVSSLNPLTPADPDGALALATLKYEPYTAYVPGEVTGIIPNLSIEKIQHKRWTMKDISDLQTRVNNIEYYTALNLLEKNAQSLQIQDVNGINRFKNGILVDDFSSFATADTANQDFNASINRREKKMSASHVVDNISLTSTECHGALNRLDPSLQTTFKVGTVGKTTNIFCLPYTSANLAVQRLASSTINVNPFSSPVYQGLMTLNPPMDNWVDNTVQPDLLIVDPGLQIYQQSSTLNTLNIGDWKVIPGTQVSSSVTTVSGGGERGTSTTTTQTYASLTQTNTLGNYNQIDNTYSVNNNYITDISILPYIRSQEILVRAKGLSINTPISCWFDGVNVNQYMFNPNIIELTSVTGVFKEDDIIGFIDPAATTPVGINSSFFPVASVVSVYQYPSDTTKVRLYINSDHGFDSFRTTTNVLKNATFNPDGTYKTSTATGTCNFSTVQIPKTQSGFVNGVGGTFSDANGYPISLFNVTCGNWHSEMNNYAVWTDNKQGTTFGTGGSIAFTVNFPTTGTYKFVFHADNNGSVVVDSTTIGTLTGTTTTNYTTPHSYTSTVTAGNHTLTLNASNASGGPAGVALRIYDPSNNLIWHTRSTNNIATNAYLPAGASTFIKPIYGGVMYKNVTQIALANNASNSSTFYTNSTLNITTIPNNGTDGSPGAAVTYTRPIKSYDPVNKIVTIETPVDIYIGYSTATNSVLTSKYSITGNVANYVVSANTGSQAKLSTNEAGNFTAVFNVPANMFNNGERIFRIDNRLVNTSPGTATTYAEAKFTASGIATKSQSLDFGVSVDGATNVFKSSSLKSSQFVTTSTVTSSWFADPLAQTFVVTKDNYQNGAFLKSVKLFFATKPTTTNTPISVFIVGTLNGYPNGETLDNSIVSLTPDKVQVSTTPHYLDPASYTEFTFTSPVYMQPDVMYAIVVQTNSTEYNVYTAEQNGIAITSTVKNLPTDATPSVVTKIGTAPYVGSLFESQNGSTWSAAQGRALMFTIERCKFDITQNPKLPFSVMKNIPTRKITSQDIAYYYDANTISGLSKSYIGNDLESHAHNVTTTDFVPTGARINYTYTSTLAGDRTITAEQSIVPGKYGSPTYDDIYLNDNKGIRVLDANSNSSFIMYVSMTSSDDAITPMVCDDGMSMYNIRWNINNLELSNNVITISDGGNGYNVNTTSVYVSMPDVGSDQANAKIILSDTVNGVIGGLYVDYPGSGYISTPTIVITDDNTRIASGNITTAAGNSDVWGKDAKFDTQMEVGSVLYTTSNIAIGTIQTIINANSIILTSEATDTYTEVDYFSSNTNAIFTTHGETSPSGGNAVARYFTKKVVLTPESDSADLRVYYTAYKPYGTNINIYCKLLNRNDTQTFEDSDWQLMTTINNSNIYSKDRNDLIEYVAAPGMNSVPDNFITYTNNEGITFSNFSQFAIKIVLSTNDKTSVPFLNDMRTIALPSGSGIA